MQFSASSGRPTYHLTPPKGWLNDPCAPGFDPRTGLYHLFFQWNPNSVDWGDLSWGHATSKDLVYWSYSSPSHPVLKPDQLYDHKGVFTGCFWPANVNGSPGMTVFYTSVTRLPFSWDKPYPRGCEGLAAASSFDQGKTWAKLSGNPMLAEEPPNLDVTGFRDPYVFDWPEMNQIRRTTVLYGLLSGGIRHQGPRIFLYAINPVDLTKWDYLGLLLDVPINDGANIRWKGDFGVNLECAQLVTLRSLDGQHSQLTLIAGSEGSKEPAHLSAYHQTHPQVPAWTGQCLNWAFVHLIIDQQRQCGAALSVHAAGHFAGCQYAMATQQLSDGRIVAWVWIMEQDISLQMRQAKGWTGDLGVPRELFLQRLDDVTAADASLVDIGNIALASKESVFTLGIKPLRELEHLREPLIYSSQSPVDLRIDRLAPSINSIGLACEILAIFSLAPHQTSDVGLLIEYGGRRSTFTSIVYQPSRTQIVVDREHSNSRDDINKSPVLADFTLFTQSSGQEQLCLRIFVDHDILEMFANDRLSLVTRLYTGHQQRSLSILGDEGTLDSLTVWPMASIGLHRAVSASINSL